MAGIAGGMMHRKKMNAERARSEAITAKKAGHRGHETTKDSMATHGNRGPESTKNKGCESGRPPRAGGETGNPRRKNAGVAKMGSGEARATYLHNRKKAYSTGKQV
ncbi:hypothetical protein TRVL_09909 [Trypanosoma vivax]|nr:hypothetical protein TRVL_09909 [Trypanosoma vivax]